MASNLPPGCRDSDIPGNRPEDIILERLSEEVYKIFPDVTDEQMDEAMNLLARQFNEGFESGASAEAERKFYEKQEKEET